MSEEAPPLRIVVSDPKGGRRIVKVKVKGVEDEKLEYTDEMRRLKEKGVVKRERGRLPYAKLNSKLARELELDDKIGVVTIRFKTGQGKITEPFKAIIDDSVPDGEIHVNMEQLGELIGEMEKEAEAFKAKAWQVAVPQKQVERLAGLEIGDVFEGSVVGLPGVRLKIRGGSDATGLPMHPGVPGSAKKKVLLEAPPGYRPEERGERRKKTVRGRMVPDPRGERRKTVLAQLNVVVSYE